MGHSNPATYVLKTEGDYRYGFGCNSHDHNRILERSSEVEEPNFLTALWLPGATPLPPLTSRNMSTDLWVPPSSAAVFPSADSARTWGNGRCGRVHVTPSSFRRTRAFEEQTAVHPTDSPHFLMPFYSIYNWRRYVSCQMVRFHPSDYETYLSAMFSMRDPPAPAHFRVLSLVLVGEHIHGPIPPLNVLTRMQPESSFVQRSTFRQSLPFRSRFSYPHTLINNEL